MEIILDISKIAVGVFIGKVLYDLLVISRKKIESWFNKIVKSYKHWRNSVRNKKNRRLRSGNISKYQNNNLNNNQADFGEIVDTKILS